MKKTLFCVALGFVGISVSAATFYEPFNYDPLVVTNLIGQTNPDGITWTMGGSNSLNQPTIMAGNLDYPGLSPSSGNSIKFGGNGMSARFPFAGGVNSGTLYYSFILKVTDITGISTTPTGIFWAGFNNSVGSQTGPITSAHSRIYTKGVTENGTNGFQIGIGQPNGSSVNLQYATNVFFTNDVIFIVASYTYNPAAADDEAKLWINPDTNSLGTASPPTPTASAITGGVSDATTFQSFVFFNRNAGEPAGMIADELLISTNWAEVTPLATTLNFITQPRSQTVVPGVNTFFDVSTYRAQNYQWQLNNVNIADATNRFLFINNAQSVNAGDYQIIASNPSVTKTSIVATLTVTNGTFPVLTPLWSIAPNSRPYVTTNTSGSPLQQSIAYNALSNQVIIVSRTNATSGLTINVLDATTGAFLYEMDTSAVSASTASPLTMMDVADDGSIYAGNTTGNGSLDSYRLYRWANSASNTVAVKLFEGGDPAYQSTAFRWGDTLDVRGSGTNTEVLVDCNAVWATVFKPTDETLTSFLTYPITNNYNDGSIGRSIQFGTNNTYWEKRKGDRLQMSSYVLPEVIYGGSTVIAQNNNYPSTIGPVGFNLSTNLLAGIGFALSNSAPDTLDFYQINDFNNPILLGKYNFPVNQQGNANSFGQVVVATNRVFAIDGNNGVVAFTITNAPPAAPQLTATLSGNQVTISWPSSATGYVLQSTPSLSPINWTTNNTPVIPQGGFNTVTESASTGTKFYRLKN